MRRKYTVLARLTAFLFPLITLLAVGVLPALAHTHVEIGAYELVIGWLNEPSVVGERNRLIIRVSLEGEIVTGLESTLDAEVLYGGRIFRANLNPVDAEGWYSIEIIPTIRGQYTLRLVGMIGDLEVDELIEPEEILPQNILAFPEPPPDVFALRDTVTSLQNQLQTMTAVAFVGIVLGGVALVIALLGVLRQRRN